MSDEIEIPEDPEQVKASDEPGPTDELASLAEVHVQAAVNRADSPVGDDPTVPTAGESAEPMAPGPGPIAEELGLPGTVLLDPAGNRLDPETGYPEEGETRGLRSGDGSYDPGEYTVADVNEYIADNPDQADAVLAAERAGKNRAGIVG